MLSKVIHVIRCVLLCLPITVAAPSFAAGTAAKNSDRQLLRTLLAEREINRLMTDYVWLLDAGDYDAWGKLFTNGALLDRNGNVVAKGAEATAALTRKYLGNQPDITLRHLVSSPQIDVDVAAGTATASSFLFTIQAPKGQPAAIFRIASYHDRFQFIDGRWQFVSRQEVTDWVLKERTAQ